MKIKARRRHQRDEKYIKLYIYILVGKEEGKGLLERSRCRSESDNIIFYTKHGVKI